MRSQSSFRDVRMAFLVARKKRRRLILVQNVGRRSRLFVPVERLFVQIVGREARFPRVRDGLGVLLQRRH